MKVTVSTIIDVVTIAPFLGWAIMSITSIPSYTAEGWMAPVYVAIGSTILCGLATREMWLRSHDVRRKFIYLVFDEDAAKARVDNSQMTAQKLKGLIAGLCTLLCLVFTLVFLLAEYTVIAPAEKLGMPCACETWVGRNNGTDACCKQCTTDPNCVAWSTALVQSNSLAGVCSPSITAAEPQSSPMNSGFSCLADGFWMLVTFFFAGFWLLIVLCRPISKAAPIASAVPGCGSSTSSSVPATV